MHHAEHRATHQVSTTQYPSYPPQVSSIQFIVEGQNKLIVAGGWNLASAEVYDEVLGRWLRLPRDLPHNLGGIGSALL